MGGSGCGKSTLLRHIIGSLKPDAGEIYIHGTEITKLDDEGMSKIRKRFGMLFQTGALFQLADRRRERRAAHPRVERGRAEHRRAGW